MAREVVADRPWTPPQLIDGAECAGGVRQSGRRSPHQFSSPPSQGRPAAGAQMHPRPRTTIDSPSWRSGSIGGMARSTRPRKRAPEPPDVPGDLDPALARLESHAQWECCLLYTSDAADE